MNSNLNSQFLHIFGHCNKSDIKILEVKVKFEKQYFEMKPFISHISTFLLSGRFFFIKTKIKTVNKSTNANFTVELVFKQLCVCLDLHFKNSLILLT